MPMILWVKLFWVSFESKVEWEPFNNMFHVLLIVAIILGIPNRVCPTCSLDMKLQCLTGSNSNARNIRLL